MSSSSFILLDILEHSPSVPTSYLPIIWNFSPAKLITEFLLSTQLFTHTFNTNHIALQFLSYQSGFVVVVQLLSRVSLDPKDCKQHTMASLSFTISQSLLKLMYMEGVSDNIQLLLPSIFPPSGNESALFQWVSSFHQVAKVLELQLQHQSFQ